MNGEVAHKLASIWQHSSDALVLADVKGQQIVDANPSAEVLFGYSVEEFRKLKIKDIHPPDGLVGEAIIPEAQVVAVADVFEAMSSHRPYRPALGAKAALEAFSTCNIN